MNIDERYQRNLGVIGEDGHEKLRRSRVAIVGAGGLGGTVFEVLVRFGIGEITIIDFDRFEESNLNRQILSSMDEIGESKAIAAMRRAKQINPDVKITAIVDRIDRDNAEKLVGSADVICDCVDSIPLRFVLQRSAGELKVPLIHAAVAGTKGQIMTIFPGDTGLTPIYGKEEEAPEKGDEKIAGTPPSTVMAIASCQAHETISVLTGIQKPLQNTLLRINLGEWRMESFKV